MGLFDRKKKYDKESPALVGNNTEEHAQQQHEQVQTQSEPIEQPEEQADVSEEQQGYSQPPGNPESGYPTTTEQEEDDQEQQTEQKETQSDIVFNITTKQSDKIVLTVPVGDSEIVYKELKAAKQLRTDFEYPGLLLDGADISFFSYELAQ